MTKPISSSLAATAFPIGLAAALIVPATIATGPGRAAPTAGVNGQTLYKVQCAACHSTAPGKSLLGPSLAGTSGRKAGRLPGFAFSPAMKNSNLKWDKATLERFLANPRKTVPRTTMVYAGEKDAAKRSALVQYVLTLK